MTAQHTPELWLAVGFGEQNGETRICRDLAAVVDFMWEQCGPDASGDEARTRDCWADHLADEDNWTLADGYGRWRCDIDIGETGHITIQRMTMDGAVYAAPELLDEAKNAHLAITTLLDSREGQLRLSHDWRASLLVRQSALSAAIAKATQP